MSTTAKKLAALLAAAAAIATVGTSSAALADGRFNKEIRASERHYDFDHRYFHYGHYFDYGSDCYWVHRSYGVVKVCPDVY